MAKFLCVATIAIFIVIIAIVLISPIVFAADKKVTISWSQQMPDPSGADIKGWNIYKSEAPGVYGETSRWIQFVWDEVIKQTYSASELIPQPPIGEQAKTYYFVVTAYSDDAESDYSDEVSATIQPEAIKVPGKPTNVRVEQE